MNKSTLDMLKELLEGSSEEKIEVGEIPQYLVDKIEANANARRKLKNERELAIKQAELNYERKVVELELDENHNEIWGEVYKLLKLSPEEQEEKYSIDKRTRKLYKHV